MPLRKYLTIMVASNLGLWLAWALVITNLDPTSGGRGALVFFYLTLFGALSGTLALAGFGLRCLFFRSTPLYRHLAPSHRWGFIISGLVILALVLQASRLLAWWNELLLLAIGVGLEALFLSRQRERV